MTDYEQAKMLAKLDAAHLKLIAAGEKADELLPKEEQLKLRRLRRKLKVKRLRSQNGLKWTLDEGVSVVKAASVVTNEAFLVPAVKPEVFVSQYTHRTLKPFIRRDFRLKSVRVRMHEELLKSRTRASLDFMYLRPHMVKAVNSLAGEYFWPGIDVTDQLEHPDFSVVAIYKRMVVGFAFLTPNISHTEAYLTFLWTHPEWRRLGLATFFIYHLVQSCSGQDIVLHASADNPAVILYQSFGFKVEERVNGFYEKFLPPRSPECRHALFLRLAR